VHKQAEGMAPVRRKGGGGGGAEAGASKKSGGSGRSFWGKAGFEGEVAKNLIDVVCTWGMLTGMAGSAVWSNWAIPHFCSATSEADTVHVHPCCGAFASSRFRNGPYLLAVERRSEPVVFDTVVIYTEHVVVCSALLQTIFHLCATARCEQQQCAQLVRYKQTTVLSRTHCVFFKRQCMS